MSHRELYPSLEPYDHGFLQVSPVHSLYYEQSGNPQGNPGKHGFQTKIPHADRMYPKVVYLHGGPGGGTSPDDRRYFNPELYRIVVFDQRGAGKSTPSACLEENTTWDLVEDIERLRKHLKIEKWVVFGGSWGSTLSLSYAIKHADCVKGLILRGIFTLRKSEVDWFYQNGASHIFPDFWDIYEAPIPVDERHNFIQAYYKRLTGNDARSQLECAKAWSKWECATSKLFVDPKMIKKVDNDTWALAFARIECHYFINKGFFPTDDWILQNVDKIKHIPGVIVQGRYDVVCPAKTAWELHKKWGAELVIVPDSGHSAKEPATRSHLIAWADKFAQL